MMAYASRLTLFDEAFDRALVVPDPAAQLLEMAERVPIHPLPSVVMYQAQLLADPERPFRAWRRRPQR